MKLAARHVAQAVRSFRATLAVFASVTLAVWREHEAVAAWLVREAGPRHVTDSSSVAPEFWIVLAVRIGLLAALIPLMGEGWLFVCGRLRATKQARLWPLVCVVAALALAGSAAFALLAARRSCDFIVCFEDARIVSRAR